MSFINLPTQVTIEMEYEILIPDFLSGRKRDCIDLSRHLEEKNWSEIKRIGHLIAGVCGGYGFDDLGLLGRRIENLSVERQGDEILKLIKIIESYLKDVKIIFV